MIDSDMIDSARRLGSAFAVSDGAGRPGTTGRRDMSQWSDHEDMPTIAEVWEEATGYDWPEAMTDEAGDEIEAIGEAFKAGYNGIFDEIEAIA